MASGASIQIRLDARTKAKAQRHFRRLGLSTSAGIRLLLDQALTGGPQAGLPDAETLEAFADIEAGRTIPVTLEQIREQWDRA
ncbi:MAG: type II toxin-antitoxin system RelB/DinJ family antitoxin [Planctomycetota bacterium]|jgi:addiction module RelB/DinJ family antitoxin|nr:type II toxin-antitoxin system RelB/DinJ family antitoxin [Planctomycetota bacterium]